MAGAFQIELDTNAPQAVSWNAPGSTFPGDSLNISYQLNEPEVLSAKFVLSDASEINGILGVNTVLVNVPVNAALGYAQLRTHVRDNVWNEGQLYSPQIIVGGGAVTGQPRSSDDDEPDVGTSHRPGPASVRRGSDVGRSNRGGAGRR